MVSDDAARAPSRISPSLFGRGAGAERGIASKEVDDGTSTPDDDAILGTNGFFFDGEASGECNSLEPSRPEIPELILCDDRPVGLFRLGGCIGLPRFESSSKGEIFWLPACAESPDSTLC